MTIGDGNDRPVRRSRIADGEPGTAPIAYLPGALAGAAGTGTGPDDSRDPTSAGPMDRAATSDSRSSADRATRGAHPAGTGRITADGSGEPNRREPRAANVSMSALTRRGMSRWELERTLRSREIDQDAIDAELERLESVGLVDDAALAETVVRTQHERKGLGRSAIVADLRRRHIDQEHIDAALEQVDDDGEMARARELAERRARQLTALDRETAVRRLTGYLMRKGYPSSVVRSAVDEALPAGGGGVRFR